MSVIKILSEKLIYILYVSGDVKLRWQLLSIYTAMFVHSFIIFKFLAGTNICSTQEDRTSEICILRTEMKHCTDQVEKLTEEVCEVKKLIEASQVEVDTTRHALIEITRKVKEL